MLLIHRWNVSIGERWASEYFILKRSIYTELVNLIWKLMSFSICHFYCVNCYVCMYHNLNDILGAWIMWKRSKATTLFTFSNISTPIRYLTSFEEVYSYLVEVNTNVMSCSYQWHSEEKLGSQEWEEKGQWEE